MKMTNAEFLTAVAKKAPKFAEMAAKNARDVFTEAGFESLKNLPGTEDNVTEFYHVALLVGLQTVEHAKFKDVLAAWGILERFNMDMGAYMQQNRVKRIKNVNPAWLGKDGKGLQNGDSVDPFIVRKPEIVQDYFGLNWNYQNFFSLQDFDLKRGWITPGDGIQSIVSAIYEMVDLDRLDTEFAKFFEVYSGALSSTKNPLQDTQQIQLSSWTDGAPTDAEIRELIEILKNILETFDSQPSIDLYNAGKYPNSASGEDLTVLIRMGIKSKFDSMMAYVFGEKYLTFPIKVFGVANFGGIKHYAANDTQFATELKPVTDKDGVYTGYYSADGTESGQIAEAETVQVDPHADVIATINERGLIFELIQNEMRVRPILNPRGEYENTFFNQMNNGINYNHYKDLITISKPGTGAAALKAKTTKAVK